MSLYGTNIIDLPPAGTITGNEVVAVVQNGITSRTTTGDIGGGGASAFIDLTDVPHSYSGQSGKVAAVKTTEDGLEFIAVGGTGTVTSVSVTAANGVSGSVATATTTPAITISLGAITPTSVAASGAVSGSNLSGTNTGDQTITLSGDVSGSGTGAITATISGLSAAKIGSGVVDNTEFSYLNGVTSSIQTQIDNKQPLDADLTTIAGLTATTDNIIQSVSSSWASRTPTQVTATLTNMVGDSGSGGAKGLVPAPAAGDAAASKFLKADGTWAVPSGGGGSGITRSVNSISSPATAGSTASTDYVYFVSGTTTLTLPTAVSNTNKYTVKNTGSNTVTIATTSAQTIDGSSTASLPVPNTSLDLISDGSNWRIV